MRKTALLLILSVAILVTSCNTDSKKQITVAEAGYTCLATVIYNNLTIKTKLNVSGGGIFLAEIIEPKALSGLKFEFNNDNMLVSYNGIKQTNSANFKSYGFAELLKNVFAKLTAGGTVAEKQGDEYLLSGFTSGIRYALTLNKQGLPLCLKMPKAELTANFSDWNYAK